MGEMRYKKTVFNLEENVAAILDREAFSLGLNNEELLRFVIGQWARGILAQAGGLFKPQIVMQSFNKASDVGRNQSQQIEDIVTYNNLRDTKAASMAGRLLMKDQIAHGQLKCPNCSMPLQWKRDFLAEPPVCGSCSFPLDKDLSDGAKAGNSEDQSPD